MIKEKANGKKYAATIQVKHQGCWASELSSKFKGIESYMLIRESEAQYYEGVLVIRSKNKSPLSNDALGQIYRFLALENSVVAIEVINKGPPLLILALKVRDSGNIETQRILQSMGGQVLDLMPYSSIDGVERVTIVVDSEKEACELARRLGQSPQYNKLSLEIREIDDPLVGVSTFLNLVLDKEDNETLKKVLLANVKEFGQTKDFGKFSRLILEAVVKYVFAKPS
jgi:hypothetical protein